MAGLSCSVEDCENCYHYSCAIKEYLDDSSSDSDNDDQDKDLEGDLKEKSKSGDTNK